MAPRKTVRKEDSDTLAEIYCENKRLKAEVAAAREEESNMLATLHHENARLKAQVAAARKGARTYYASKGPWNVSDLLPFQRQHAASHFRKTSFDIFAKLRRDGFIVLELPTADRNKLASAHQSLMSYRCQGSFEGALLSARNLPGRHVLEFNAGATAVLVDEELPRREDGWTPAHQADAFEAMLALKVATTSVLDAISLSTGVGINTVRQQLLEDDVAPAGESLSSSILHVVSYAPASPTEATRVATQGEHVDAGLLTAVYCPTEGLEVQVPPGPNRPGQPNPPPEWTPVPFGYNTIVLMVGYTLEHATAGVLRACVHRVRPSIGMPGRTALAFKLRARSTATLPRGLMLFDTRTPCQEAEVDGPDTVSTLMQTFRQAHGPPLNGATMIPAPEGEKQVLRRMHAEMSDCRRRAEVGYSNQLFVKCLDGKTVTLEFDTPWSPLLDLKRRLQQVTGVPLAEMRLIYAGRQLEEDYKTLADHNLQHYSTIHLLVRLRGD